MNIREAASLACKILGIYVIVQGIGAGFNITYLYLSNHDQTVLLNYSLVFGYLLSGILLLVFSDRLSVIVGKKINDNKEIPRGLNGNVIQRIAFSVLGMYFIGSSLPRLVSLILSISFPDLVGSAPVLFTILKQIDMIVELIIGIVLLLGSEGLVNILNKIRGFRMDVENQD